MPKLFLISTLMFLCASISARTLTGIITNEKGEIITNATVFSVVSGKSVISDKNGKYTIITDTDNDNVIEVSADGYESMLFDWIDESEKNFSLKESNTLLEEMVVVGYGSIKKNDATGALSSVKKEKIENLQTQSITQALTGQMAGVRIMSAEGAPDAETKIVIRGGGSITQDNSPLYIVDGFPVNSIADLPINDIESVSILKDASSTAIYGARGANGVIIITTKQADNTGKMQINYNSNYGIRKISNKLSTLSASDFVKMQYELSLYNTSASERFTNRYGIWNDIDIYEKTQSTDWQDKTFGNEAFFSNQYISLKYGSELINYKIAYSHENSNGIMTGSNLTKQNLSFSANKKLLNRASLDIQAKYTKKEVLGAGTSSAGSSTSSRLKHSVIFTPVESPYINDDYDDETAYSSLNNPISVTKDDYRNTICNNLQVNAALEISLLKNENLKFKSDIGFLNSSEDNYRAYGISTSQAKQYGGQPIATIRNEKTEKLRLSNTLTYTNKKTLSENKINIMAGQELVDEQSSFLLNESRYFPLYIGAEQALKNMSLGIPQPTTSFTYTPDRLFSIFSRANYSFKDKYLATISIRADRSSKFALKNQWGYFPSGAAAWRFTEEKFLKEQNFLNNGKIRLSYGFSGNNRIKGNMYQRVYEAGKTTDASVFFDEVQQAFLQTGNMLANANLKWETTVTRNAGIDLSFLKNRLQLSIEIYKNTTKDLLIESAIPTVSGYRTTIENIGETSNKGLELELFGIIIKSKDFSFSASGNISFNRNRVEKLGDIKSTLISSGWAGSEISSDYILQSGKEIGLMYGFVTDGYYKTEDFDYNPEDKTYTLKDGIASNSELLSSATYFGPGFIKFEDLNGDGQITEDGDRTVIGNANPKCTGGIDINVKYKNWCLTANGYFSYGNDIYNANKIEFTTTNKYQFRNMTSEMSEEDRWTNIGKNGEKIYDPNELDAINSNAKIWSPYIGRYVFHSWAVEDGSFFRLSNVTLGYELPQYLTSKLHLQKIFIYLSADNIFCITKYSGFDPEVSTRNSTPLTPGVDYSAYPRSRSYSLGINIAL